MTVIGKTVYTDKLDKIVSGYNDFIHIVTRIKPKKVTTDA